MCSVDAARAAGAPEDRWVFPLSGADAHDHWYLSERIDLHSSPAVAVAGGRALALAGVGIDDVAHVDLYSCFPSAVQMAAAALGLPCDDPGRSLTVTGGLGFAGGPGNNYVTHSIAAMAEVLRSDPGSLGLVTGLGWYATKHAVGLWSTDPPAAASARPAPAGGGRAPRRDPAPGHVGPATVETYTVVYDRGGDPTAPSWPSSPTTGAGRGRRSPTATTCAAWWRKKGAGAGPRRRPTGTPPSDGVGRRRARRPAP